MSRSQCTCLARAHTHTSYCERLWHQNLFHNHAFCPFLPEMVSNTRIRPNVKLHDGKKTPKSGALSFSQKSWSVCARLWMLRRPAPQGIQWPTGNPRLNTSEHLPILSFSSVIFWGSRGSRGRNRSNHERRSSLASKHQLVHKKHLIEHWISMGTVWQYGTVYLGVVPGYFGSRRRSQKTTDSGTRTDHARRIVAWLWFMILSWV